MPSPGSSPRAGMAWSPGWSGSSAARSSTKLKALPLAFPSPRSPATLADGLGSPKFSGENGQSSTTPAVPWAASPEPAGKLNEGIDWNAPRSGSLTAPPPLPGTTVMISGDRRSGGADICCWVVPRNPDPTAVPRSLLGLVYAVGRRFLKVLWVRRGSNPKQRLSSEEQRASYQLRIGLNELVFPGIPCAAEVKLHLRCRANEDFSHAYDGEIFMIFLRPSRHR